MFCVTFARHAEMSDEVLNTIYDALAQGLRESSTPSTAAASRGNTVCCRFTCISHCANCTNILIIISISIGNGGITTESCTITSA